MTDALRGGLDAAEYKHVALGLVFLQFRRAMRPAGYEEDQRA
jgi:hypothetical protein